MQLKMIYNPTITNEPNKISINRMRLLKKKGSINEAKNAPVLMVTKATETLDTLMALKKVIQCKAMIIPESKNLIKAILSTLNPLRVAKKNRAMITDANDMRYHTVGTTSIEISFPKIAVNPQIKTIK